MSERNNNAEGPSRQSTTPAPAQSTSASASTSRPVITGHPVLSHNLEGDTMVITLDFRGDFDRSRLRQERSSLLAAIRTCDATCDKVNIRLDPYEHGRLGQNWNKPKDMKPFQIDTVKEVVHVLNECTNRKVIDVVLGCPEEDWERIKSLAPFYGLNDLNWTCSILDGYRKVEVVEGNRWDMKLKDFNMLSQENN